MRNTGRNLMIFACVVCPHPLMSTPHTKKPKTRGPYKKHYSHDQILRALDDLRSARRLGQPHSHKTIGDRHGVPVTTLRDWERKTLAAIASAPRHSIPAEVVETAVTTNRQGLHLRLLSEDVEDKLVKWINICDEMAQPPDTYSIRYKAMRLHYAENKIEVDDENYSTIASENCWQRFSFRHPHLAIRTPQPLALKRAKATQPEIINRFYQLLEHWIKKLGVQPHQIWAGDETGVDEKFRVRKVVTNKGTNTHTNTQKKIFVHALTLHIHVLIFICFS